jgi:hypothetical protein
MLFRSIVAASCLLVAACAADSSEPKTADQDKPAKTDEGPKRLVVTKKLLEDNQLGPADLAQLQLYLKGRIVLRRESGAGTREITQQHTLKVVDGKTIEEVVVESGTPGISVGTGALRVNFDPEEPDAGFDFDLDEEGRISLHFDTDPEGPHTVEYGGQVYDIVTGERARLEIEAEKLRDYVTNQRKLPGTKLP